MIACTSRDEINLVAGHARRRSSPSAQTIVRTSNPEYIEAWQERQIDVDFMVSSELETAHAVSRTIGVPAAKQTDVFADGQVQIVEFDVPLHAPGEASYGEVVGSSSRRRRFRRTPRWRASSAATACSSRAAASRSCPATGSSSSARPTRRGNGAA